MSWYILHGALLLDHETSHKILVTINVGLIFLINFTVPGSIGDVWSHFTSFKTDRKMK